MLQPFLWDRLSRVGTPGKVKGKAGNPHVPGGPSAPPLPFSHQSWVSSLSVEDARVLVPFPTELLSRMEGSICACARKMLLLLGVILLAARDVHCSVRVPGNVPKKPSVDEAIASCESAQAIDYVNPGQRSTVRDAVVLEMCRKGSSHVILDPTLKQFSVFLLHRDNFDPEVKWHSGDATDVINDKYFFVNEVATLKETGYKWYSLGYPMWPLPHQAVSVSTGRSSLFGRRKEDDWPNYGLATPIYFASNSWRNQMWSLEEFFQQEKGSSKFKNHKEFHKLAKEMMGTINPAQVESYNEWPFLKSSLLPMVKSMVKRNKGICPDELYLYFRFTPCHPKEAQQVACDVARLQARNILTEADCRTTDIVVAYSEVGGDIMSSGPVVETPIVSSAAVSVHGAAPPSSSSSSSSSFSSTNNSSSPFAGSSPIDETLLFPELQPRGIPQGESNPHSKDDSHPHDDFHTHSHDTHHQQNPPPPPPPSPKRNSLNSSPTSGGFPSSWLLLLALAFTCSVSIGQVYKNNAL
ncbi:uncharacterized protein LOC143039352 [Oratosquilla oratoria]|uniref:uncharacterized protein LOC143039352 n=1 Tax=Oratosquilla oratoria TaxID=337810 RepID=UPI003F76AF5D